MKKLNFYQFGRSMIEMLGVLAIIGVLSVGAIAGYQKAMFKYKENKASEQLNHLIAAVTRYKNQKDNITTPMLYKLGALTMEPSKCNSWGECFDDYWYAKDAMGNYWQVNGSDWGGDPSPLVITNHQSQADKYVFDTLKEWHAEIDKVFLDSVSDPNALLGDKYCNGENTFSVSSNCMISGEMCLKDLDNKTIYSFLENCASRLNPNGSMYTIYIFVRQ